MKIYLQTWPDEKPAPNCPKTFSYIYKEPIYDGHCIKFSETERDITALADVAELLHDAAGDASFISQYYWGEKDISSYLASVGGILEHAAVIVADYAGDVKFRSKTLVPDYTPDEIEEDKYADVPNEEPVFDDIPL